MLALVLNRKINSANSAHENHIDRALGACLQKPV